MLAAGFAWNGFSQNLLPTYPNYERYARLRSEIFGSISPASINPIWAPDSSGFAFSKNGEWQRFDIRTKEITTLSAPPESNGGSGSNRVPRRRQPDRGRQFDTTYTEDGKMKAFHRNRNVFIANADGSNEIQVTQEGDATKRIKFGIASWVYGEELGVREALWFSPDGRKLAFYKFDESKVPDYFLTLSQQAIQDSLDVEAYPKAGSPNPEVGLFVYDLQTKRTVEMDVRDGKPFENDVVGHYVYSVRWPPNGKELYFNRTNRKQNIMEWVAANPETGKCRVIIREEWPASWTENSPEIRWLNDDRFIWSSERSGFNNFYLYNTQGKLLSTITKNAFDSGPIVRVDEKTKTMYYMGRDGDTPYKMQLHRVSLDGTNDKRLTDPKFNHRVNLAPDGSCFVDTYETHDIPPAVRVVNSNGNVIKELASTDESKFKEMGLQKAELFTFTAADGKTICYGMLKKPSNFDPNKKYPLLISVYAGPESGMVDERFEMPDPITELGFCTAYFDGRGTSGRGKAFKDAIYGKLGVVEIDDQAAGAAYLAQRPYIDASKIGIHGTSYGGYASVMCLLRHPEGFSAACAASSVTDWRNYDSIYTERYMGLPQQNKEGYDAGSAMTYADALKGRLMLYYGTADNNVHPSNTLQLIAAFRGRKNFELQVGVDQGHSGINGDRMLEFFIQSLILDKR